LNGGFLPRLIRGIPYILAAVVTTIVLEHFGLFAVVDTRMLDAFLLTSSARHADPFAGQVFPHVTIVGIDDDDYNDKNLFNAESPLKPALIAKLIAAVEAQRPRVVGVDIDTGSKLYAGTRRPFVPKPDWSPIVWAAAGTFDDEDCLTGRDPVLGGVANLVRAKDGIGIDDLPVDDDGQIRHYQRAFASAGAGHCSETAPAPRSAWSFVTAVSRAFCSAGTSDCAAERKTAAAVTPEHLLIDFRGECVAASSSECIARATAKNDDAITQPHVYVPASILLDSGNVDLGLQDRVVLIGGFFKAGRDGKATSFGERQGVELLARAIETELGGGGVRDTPLWAAVLFDVVVGVLLIYVGYRFTLWPALGITLALFPLTIIASSFLAFLKLGHWVSIAPIFFGMALHTAFEDGIENAERRRDRERESRHPAPAVDAAEEAASPPAAAPPSPPAASSGSIEAAKP
jgi:CHASE2 domain-containing sensor protein